MEEESKTTMAVATATVLGTPDTPIEQAKKEIDEELGQEGSIEDLDFAGTFVSVNVKLGKMIKTIQLIHAKKHRKLHGIGRCKISCDETWKDDQNDRTRFESEQHRRCGCRRFDASRAEFRQSLALEKQQHIR